MFFIVQNLNVERAISSGQQISWKAARSINHKFKRLYDPSLPEDVNDYEWVFIVSFLRYLSNTIYRDKSPSASYPTAAQVAATDPVVLRTAGLSARKGEYRTSTGNIYTSACSSLQVQDLASRFADGRLSTEKLLNATDEELSDLLIAVKGIGKWTGRINLFIDTF